jgi:hypothetical protein
MGGVSSRSITHRLELVLQFLYDDDDNDDDDNDNFVLCYHLSYIRSIIQKSIT